MTFPKVAQLLKAKLYQDSVNKYWRQRSLSDDNFYFGLGDRIQDRQDSKVPVAGAGTVEFLSIAGDVTKGVSLFFPPVRKLTALFEYAEKIAREKSGIKNQ